MTDAVTRSGLPTRIGTRTPSVPSGRLSGPHAFSTLGERWGRAEAIVGLAAVATDRCEDETAALLTGCIESTYAESAAQVIAPDALIAARFLARARQRLGVQQWSAIAQQGAAVRIVEAADVALAHVGQ